MREFDIEIVKNPEIFMENRIAAHSDHIIYKTIQEAEEENSSFYVSLDGIWKFHYGKNYASTVKGFEKPEYDCKNWDNIRVPAHIQMEGYDIPQYANIQYPWDGREDVMPGEIPVDFNPVASYVKYFFLPETFLNQKVFLSLQGAESAAAVWLNGNYIGYSEDSFTPSEFELTPFLCEGENKFAIQVFKWSSGSWCEDQDFFRFSGIFRSVFLYNIPKVHIADVKVEPLVEEDLKNAELSLELKSTAKGKAFISLSDSKGMIWKKEENLELQNHFVYEVVAPSLWSAETPVLYSLVLEIRDREGNSTEIIRQSIGFRRFELKDGIMCINGKRIVFKGVNRHEFSSKTGRAISREEVIQDIITMKQNNINAIRTCHYPDDSLIYHLCDQYGLYMIAENNMETHGSWEPVVRYQEAGVSLYETERYQNLVVPGDRENWMEMMLDRVNSCYQRDKNHPAILIWSCGNESFGGKVIYEMSRKFRQLDAHRLVHYEGIFNDRRYDDTSDMESQMYTSVSNIKKFLSENKQKPFICCEYSHAMGNSCGALHKYTDLTDTHMRYQGGFIWDYVDQSITAKNRYGEEYQAYGGDFNDRPTDYNFSGNGIVYGSDRQPSPKMQEVKFNYQNISIEINKEENKINIHNKNLFTNTSYFQCRAILLKDGKIVQTTDIETDVEPLGIRSYNQPFQIEGEGEFALTVAFYLKKDEIWAQSGHEVAFGQKVLKKTGITEVCKKPLQVIRGQYNIGVKGEEFDVLFSLGSGGLVSYRYAGKEMIKKIPMPNFWRAPVDNDMGNLAPQRYAQWKIASMYISNRCKDKTNGAGFELDEKEDSVNIRYTYYMPTTPSSKCQVEYSVTGDGTIKTSLSYDPVQELGDMPEFGMLFKLDADYDQIEWYGLGPAETYADRYLGAKLGIYKNRVSDNIAEYLVPQECGNKTGVRYAKVMDKCGRGLIFTGDEISFSALPYTPHEIENAMHAYELPRVHYTVVRVAAEQMGVGGDDSWGARVHDEYLLDISKKKSFTFSFKGI